MYITINIKKMSQLTYNNNKMTTKLITLKCSTKSNGQKENYGNTVIAF